MAVDEAKLNAFMGSFVHDLGAVMHAATIVVGDQLGWYKALSVGASAHVRQSLRPDGTWMIVEPFANDSLEQNLNPVGRVFYSASTFICTPASRSQEVGMCLGAQAGEARIREVVTKGGFGRFRRATETPFNLIYEARP
jgi:hypothetical protein